jgi:sugar lactone lactonase YvrE
MAFGTAAVVLVALAAAVLSAGRPANAISPVTTVFVSQTSGNVQQVAVSSGTHSVVGSTGTSADSLVFDLAGKLLVSGLSSPNVYRIDPTLPGGSANVGTQVNSTSLSGSGADEAINAAGTEVYVTDFGHSVDIVNLTTGAVTVHPLTGFGLISGIAFDASGQLWVTNYSGNTVGIVNLILNTYTPLCTGVAVGSGGADGLSFDPSSGKLYVSGQATNTITQLTIGLGTCTIGPVFSMGTDTSGFIIQPDGIAADGLGGVFAAGQNGDVVRLDTTTSAVTIIASGISGLDDIAPVFGSGAPPTSSTPNPSAVGGFVDVVTGGSSGSASTTSWLAVLALAVIAMGTVAGGTFAYVRKRS